MRKLLVALWSAMALIPAPVYASEETARLNAWLDRQYEEELQRSPLALTTYGRTAARTPTTRWMTSAWQRQRQSWPGLPRAAP